MKIREFKQQDLDTIKKIVKKLHPAWFDKKALINIPIDIKLQKCLVAEKKGEVVGFISFYSKDGEASVGWIGVGVGLRRRGIGRQLIKKVELVLKNIGVKTLRAETVGETTPKYKPYEETVAFYKKCGFEIEKKSRFQKEAGYKFKMYSFKKTLS